MQTCRRGPFPSAVFLGAAGTAAVGMLIMGENVTAVKLMSITFVLVGVIGLNLSGVIPP
jgi:quaternary ammonium compound-resistance protein SugE